MSRQRLEAAVLTGMERAGRDVMVWGKDDCALWCANIVNDALGYDPVASFRGRYTTRRGAMRVMGRKGLLGAMRNAARRHKWKRINPAMAQPGDVGLTWVEHAGKATLATVICRAHDWFVGRNENGWTAVRSKHVVAAWSVLDDHRPGARASLGNPDGLRKPGAVAVCHEPVSTIIGLTALISSLGVSTAVAGAIGGAIISAAISVGFALLQASLIKPQSGVGALDSSGSYNSLADTSSAVSVQVTERQSIPYKRYVVGTAFVGGALFFEQVKPPYLTMGILLSEGEIEGVTRAMVGTQELVFGTITQNTILTPLAVPGQPDYATNVRACFRYGNFNQSVDPLIQADYTQIDANFRQQNIATAVMRYHYGGTTNSQATQDAFLALWGQVARPNAYFVVKGMRVYDPRDPTQDMDDDTTWKWTNNATLIQTWYLTRDFGGRISMSRIRWDKIIASADYDDELMACADGTLIKKHTIDGVIVLNQKPFEVLQELLTANRGMVLTQGGYVWIESSRPKTPIVTIHDRILASGIKYQAANAKRDQINKLQVRCVAPEQDYQVVDGPILDRTDLQAIDQEVLPATLALNYTQDHRRAQRLQKAFLSSSRLGGTITCSVDVSILSIASEELLGNVVTFDSVLFSAANGTYLVTGTSFSDDFTSVTLALTRYDSTIETDWNPATDEQPFDLATLDVS